MTSATSAPEDEIVSARDSDSALGESFGERLRSRDPEALERFFDLYFDTIYGRVRRLVRCTQEAENLTQDIFLNLHRALPSFDPRKRVGPWVFTIAMNRVRDHWRSRRRFSEAGCDDPGTDSIGSRQPDSELERQERDDEIKQAVYRLPFGMRSVLMLRIYDGLTFDTIAKIVKLTPATARKRYSRALKFLRKSLPLEGARL